MKRATQLVLFGTISAVAVAGYWGASVVFDRPGERALKLVPADAKMVAVLDLSPTPSQVLTFKKLEDQLGPDLFKQIIPDYSEQVGFSKTVGALLADHMGKGGVLTFGTGSSGPAFLLSINQMPQFEQKMDKLVAPSFYKGLKFYRNKNKSGVVGIVGNYLAFGEKPETLLGFKRVEWGYDKSILTSARFTRHLANRPANTNFSCYIETGSTADEYVVINAGLEENGLKMALEGKVDPKNELVQRLGSIMPFDAELAKKIPAGSYLSLAVSNLGTMMTSQEITAGIADSINDNVDKDWMKTRAMVALYPTDREKVKGIDLLAVMDDSNGANPAQMLVKGAGDLANSMKEEDKNSEPLVHSTYRGAKITQVNAEVAEGIASSLKTAIQSSLSGDNEEKAGFVKVEQITDGKTLCMAEIGKVGMVSTNEALLKHAVDSYLDKTGNASWAVGNQVGMQFDLNLLGLGIVNLLDLSKMDKDIVKEIDKAIKSVASRTEKMLLTAKMTKGGDARIEAFVPIDYAELFSKK